MLVRIQVSAADDPISDQVVASAPTLGINDLTGCRFWRVFHIDGDIDAAGIETLNKTLLVDPVVDDVLIGDPPDFGGTAVEVFARVGVTDTAARGLESAAAELGIDGLKVISGRRYELYGGLDPRSIERLAQRQLANETIEIWQIGALTPDFDSFDHQRALVQSVKLAGLYEDDLIELSRQRLLSLNGTEMLAIQRHFADLGRDPTDAELETLAQTWSEHCVHKTFRAKIELEYTDQSGATTVTTRDGLLPALREATNQLDKSWLRSAFVDDAGIIAFDDEFDVAFKVETHNHPSALEPFGGANTGVGGVVRDVIGVSARPIACTDTLCFGPPDTVDADVPDGVLHPRRVRDGVVAGVGDYGNKLGLPTVNGAVLYDPGYIGNPLVYCGAVGILPHGSHPTRANVGDLIVALGGRTGRDGIHGATFSSAGMDADTAESSGAAVQIGDPITEKGLIEVIEAARDAQLYTAITDCGAGGFSSSVGEMGEDLGVDVDLAVAPLKYPGLQPWEIWLSEAQERMVIAVPPAKLDQLGELCRHWGVELTNLGRFTGTGRLVVRHGDLLAVDMAMDFVHNGLPRQFMTATWTEPKPSPPMLPDVSGRDVVLAMLSHPDVASKEEIVRTYDHEVRGGTVVRPFAGPGGDGPTDAAVLKPLGTWNHNRAVALSVGICRRVGRHDAYLMASHAVDEAVRNLVAVGADPDQVALLDNFCWGDPTKPDRLGSLVRAVDGCVDASLRYSMPFISGKDSLFNEYNGEAIPGTLLISAIGFVPDMSYAITSAGGVTGNDLWLVGESSTALGGSLFDELYACGATEVPALVADPLPRYRAVHKLIANGLVNGAHDCSDGGLAVAVAEMAIAMRLGVAITVSSAGADPLSVLGNEAPGRLVLACPRTARDEITAIAGPFVTRIGEITGGDRITMAVGVGSGDGLAGLELDVTDIGLTEAIRAFGTAA